MWFVFPQIEGLGFSAMSREYAISSLDEARAYLAHPVLGPRLTETANIIASTEGRTAEQILGPMDALKLRSSMTLFAAAAPDEPVFAEVLNEVLPRNAGRGHARAPLKQSGHRAARSLRCAQAATSPPSIASASRSGNASGVQANAGMPSDARAAALDAS